MCPVIGTLTVNLEANTAEFSGDLGKAADDARDFGQAASEAGDEAEFSMMKAKGTIALMGEEIGVHVPRHLQTFIAELPGVGVALNAAFAGVAIFALYELIDKGVAKFEKWFGSLSDLSKAEEASFNEAIKGSKELLKVREECIKASYEMAIANAAGNTVKQDELRVEMAKALNSVEGDRMTFLLAQADKEQTILQALKDKKKAAEEADVRPSGVMDDMAGLESGTKLIDAGIEKRETTMQGYRKEVGEMQNTLLKGDAALMNSQHALGVAQEGEAAKGVAAAERLSKLVTAAHATLRKEIEQGYAEESKMADEQLKTQMREALKAADEKLKAAQDANREAQRMMDEQLKGAEKAAQQQYAVDEQAGRHRLALMQSTDKQAAAEAIAAISKQRDAELAAINTREKALVACRSEFVSAEAAGGIRVFPLDGPGIGGVGVDIAAEFAS